MRKTVIAATQLYLVLLMVGCSNMWPGESTPQTQIEQARNSWSLSPYPDLEHITERLEKQRGDVALREFGHGLISTGHCPSGADRRLREVAVRNSTHYPLKVSYGGEFLSAVIPEAHVTPGVYGEAEGRAKYCVLVNGNDLILQPVRRVHPELGIFVAATYEGMTFAYRCAVLAGAGLEECDITPNARPETTGPPNPTDELLAQISEQSVRLAATHREIIRLEGELHASQQELTREHELRLIAEQTVHEQAELLRRMGHDLRLTHAQADRLRGKLAQANEQMRSMVPQSVVDAIMSRRPSGEPQYGWAVNTLLGAFRDAATSSGNFCHAVADFAIGMSPSILLTVILTLYGGPVGFLISLALDVLTSLAGDALVYVLKPLVDSVCA